ncbi:MAG: hypothetical protein ACLVFV_00150 [Clostridium sp.]
MTIDFRPFHLFKDKLGGYNKSHLEQSGKERGAFYAGNVTNRKSLICAGSDRGHWSDQQVDHAQPLQTINPRDGQHGNDKKQEFEGFETEAGKCLPAESEHRQYGSLSGTADVWIPLYENFSEQLE